MEGKRKDSKKDSSINDKEDLKIIIEFLVPSGIKPSEILESKLCQVPDVNLTLDLDYEPIIMENEGDKTIVVVRGTVKSSQLEHLKKSASVKNVWKDTHIEHFGDIDCDIENAKGTLYDVARTIGADRIWEEGIRGQDIVVGVCDQGVSETRFPVIGGWTPSGGNAVGTIDDNGDHGNMVTNAVLGIAPDAKIFDIGVLKKGNAISNAIKGFQWAITNFQNTGKPHILTNSWGIFQKEWDPDYAINPNHPFTRKVLEAIRNWIIVLFAAGNCGSKCPTKRCSDDTGPGRDIWGVNGHRDVITVGAVNINYQWVGYSSEGPAALWYKKPDLCGITHFKGYYNIDTGTSASTPICAGVAALLQSRHRTFDTKSMQTILTQTAQDLGPLGWDPRFGHGVVNAFGAFTTSESFKGNMLLMINGC